MKTESLSLAADEQVNFTLAYSSADGTLGARGTRVELVFRKLHYYGETETLLGNRLKQVDIVNQRGKKNIPLYVGIVGSNTVLNDAEPGSSGTGTQSTLRIRILNTLKGDPTNAEKNRIAFNTTGTASGRTKFTIAFDSFDDDRALGTGSEVQAIAVSSTNDDYDSTPDYQGLSTAFEITPTQNYLAPGAFLDIALTNVRSSKASGLANIYVRYEDIPGYWDGQFVCQVEKTPIVHRMKDGSRNVGIGIDVSADSQLKVGGNLGIQLSGSDDSSPLTIDKNSVNYLTVDNTGKIGIGKDAPVAKLHVVQTGSEDALRIDDQTGDSTPFVVRADGKVGIGKSAPSAKLHIVQTGSEDALRVDDQTGNSTPFVIKANGKVGIGVVNPSEKLHIKSGNFRIDEGEIQSWGPLIFHPDVNKTGNDIIKFVDSRGTTEIMRIHSNGNVGIGTETPVAKLHVVQTSHREEALKVESNANANDVDWNHSCSIKNIKPNQAASLRIRSGSAAIGDKAPATLELVGKHNGSVHGRHGWIGVEGVDGDAKATVMKFKVRGKDKDGYKWNGSNETPTRLVINEYGNVGIGIDNPTAKLHISGDMRIDEGGGLFVANVPVYNRDERHDVTWNPHTKQISKEGSSRRYKKNITPLECDYRKILELTPKKFQMKEGHGDPDKWDIGYIAEELHEIGLTSLVIYDPQLLIPDAIKYKKMCIYLTEVVKEHDKTIQALQNRIDTLEKKKVQP